MRVPGRECTKTDGGRVVATGRHRKKKKVWGGNQVIKPIVSVRRETQYKGTGNGVKGKLEKRSLKGGYKLLWGGGEKRFIG